MFSASTEIELNYFYPDDAPESYRETLPEPEVVEEIKMESKPTKRREYDLDASLSDGDSGDDQEQGHKYNERLARIKAKRQ